MVFFTCSHCGESVKKPAVAKHYQTKCRKNEPFLTCVDCLKDFRGTEYEAHTKCVTEDERYSAKGFVPKPSQNKGERKQQAWQECIQIVLKKPTLKADERDLITAISKHENVPRKKSKFINFLSNAYRQYANKNDLIDRVWLEMESVFKETTNSGEEHNQQEEKTQKEQLQEVSNNPTPRLEENGLKKDKKRKRQTDEITENSEPIKTDEKVKKKKQKSSEENAPEGNADALIPDEMQGKQGKKNKKRKEEENGQAEHNDVVADEVGQGKKKKKKKHDKITEDEIKETPETETKSKKKNKKSKTENGESAGDVGTIAEGVEEGAVKKKRKKSENKENCEEKPVEEAQEETEPPKKKKTKGEDAAGEDNKQETFDWKATILSVMNEDCKKKKIQLHKLQKKVMKLHCQILNCESSQKKEKKFMKKLKEMPQIEIDNDFVVLKS